MNISLNVDDFKQFEKEGKLDFVAEHAWKTGDPGVVFVENAYGLSTIDLKYEPKYSNPCLVEGTLLFDGDRLRRIEKGGKLWKSWYTGKKKVLELRLSDGGVLQLTPDHRIQTTHGEWIEAKDSLGKMIRLFDTFFYGGDVVIDERVVLLGFLFGDGFFSGKNKCGCYVVLNPAKEPKIVKLLEKYGFTYEKCGRFYCHRQKLPFSEEEKLLIEQINSEKELPIWLMEKDVHYIASFLRGLFAANGSIWVRTEEPQAFRQARVSLTTNSLKLALQVKQLLALFGIFTSISHSNERVTNFPKSGLHKTKVFYTVGNQNYTSLCRFADKIGFVEDWKQEKLKTYLSNYTPKSLISPKSKVIEIIEIGEKDVYDFTMFHKTKHYNAAQGGYIVSNCGEYLSVANTVCNLHAINLPEIYRQAERQNMDFYQLLFDTAKQATHFANLLLYLDEGFPLPDLIPTTREIRPIGIGLTGYHCYLLQRGLRYSDSVEEAKRVMATILLGCAEASTLWGKKISSCKALRKEQMSNMLEEAKLVSPVGNDVSFSVDDLHNGYLNIVHPTGSVSQLVHVGATGIEPLYSLKTRRIYRSKGDWKEVELIPLELYETSLDLKDIEDDCALNIAPKAQIEVMSAFQKFCTLAISKTVNLPQSASVDEIKELIRLGYEKGLKALTVFRDKCREIQVLSTSSSKTSEPVSLPDVREGRTYSFKGPRTLYVTVNRSDNKPVEVFINTGKLGSLPTVFAQALGRVISVILQQNPNVVKRIVETLKGLEHELYLCRLGDQIIKAKSIPDAVALVLEKELELELDKEMGYDVCPICGFTSLRRSGGCSFCENCGYSSC